MSAPQPSKLEIRSEYVKIQDLESFLIAEVPYGQIEPRQIRQGIIERAGLDKDNFKPKWKELAEDAETYGKLLQWQFGTEICPVVAGMRFQYLYTSSYDQPTLASLLIGYAAPRPSNAPAVAQPPRKGLSRVACSLEQRANDRINDFLIQNSPYAAPAAPARHVENAGNGGDMFSYSASEGPDRLVELCGLARDNDSVHPFLDTWSDVAADPTKYHQLLFWTFGGTIYRICKAIRVTYNEAGGPPALLIGYHGPGGTEG